MVKSIINGVMTYYPGRHYNLSMDGETESIQKSYAFGSLTIATRRDGVLKWVLGDHLSSTSITANADGSFFSELRYSAFGEIRYSSGTTPTDYRYTNQLSQESTGLYYYVARYYDPELARFIQADTLVPGAGSPGAYDRYAYVLNNPIMMNDPSGRSCKRILSPGQHSEYDCPSDAYAYPGFSAPGEISSVANRAVSILRKNDGFSDLQKRFRDEQINNCSMNSSMCKFLVSSYDFFPIAEKTEMLSWSLMRGISGEKLGWTDILTIIAENLEAAPLILTMGDVSPTGGVYSIRNPNGQVVRVGRTKDLFSRQGQYYRDPNYFDLEFVREYLVNDYATQRGLEQMMYDQYQPPLNIYRPIGITNPNIMNYINSALVFLNKLLGGK